MESYSSYIIALVLIIIAAVVIKKVASCLVKSIAMLVIVAILAYLYMVYNGII